MTRRSPFPLVTALLAVAIVAVFAVELASPDPMTFAEAHGFVAATPSFGSALTSMLVHDPDGLAHVGGNLLVLLVVGTLVERAIGSLRFLALFAAGGIAGAALHCVVDSSILVGCSGSLFAVLAVAAAIYGPAMLTFVAVLIAAAIGQAFGFGGSGDAGVSFACHLGGFALGAAVVVLSRLRGVDLRGELQAQAVTVRGG